MKTILIACFYVIGAVFITNDVNNYQLQELTLEGVWELENQQLYEDGRLSDTVENQNGYRQIKMYSKGKVMWTRYDPADSNEWFGYGTYTVYNGVLEEHLEYASGPMMKIVDTTQVFRFELVFGKQSYQQISLDEQGQRSQGETYRRIN